MLTPATHRQKPVVVEEHVVGMAWRRIRAPATEAQGFAVGRVELIEIPAVNGIEAAAEPVGPGPGG